jgi:hypothetical protein
MMIFTTTVSGDRAPSTEMRSVWRTEPALPTPLSRRRC